MSPKTTPRPAPTSTRPRFQNGSPARSRTAIHANSASEHWLSKNRLAAAFEAVEQFPVLTESRDRVEQAAIGTVREDDIISAIESDVGLMIAVLRSANRVKLDSQSGGVATVRDAYSVLGPIGCVAAACSPNTFDLLEPDRRFAHFEQFRLHALAVQRVADQIALLTGRVDRAQLVVASLLHDIGHLALSQLRPERGAGKAALTSSPDGRVHAERKDLRIDHALLGGLLARRWRLPRRIKAAIESHHADDAKGLAAYVSLADMIVHYGQGDAFSPERLEAARKACGLREEDLAKVVSEYPGSPRPPTGICPLSDRELQAVRGLAGGKRYDEIAADMGLAASTVRSHFHSIYGKIGVSDRAQAVLIAKRHGWI